MHPHHPPHSTHTRSRTPIQPQPPLHHTQDARQSIAAYKFCCQSNNLKMAIRAEAYSWYLCNKQHISNHQIAVFDSWLIQLWFIKTQRGWRTIWLTCFNCLIRREFTVKRPVLWKTLFNDIYDGNLPPSHLVFRWAISRGQFGTTSSRI